MPAAASLGAKIPVLILFGPTASGKTALLEELFIRNPSCKGEIISADSMQVYRGMDIGTAKPTKEERARIPHHLIDILDPSEQFNTGEFVRLASEAISSAANRSALPIVSGGTGFYIRNLIMGLPASPPADLEIRALLKEELKQHGASVLMEELAKCDPVSAEKIHLNDEYRLLRALEVFRISGRPLSYFAQNEGKSEDQSSFRFLILGIKWDREVLYKRINERCKSMFQSGLPDEVRKLYEAGYTPLDPGLRAIGYREFFIENENDLYTLSRDMTGVEALVAQNCRRYAKRQLVFFASIPNVTWIEGDNVVKAAAEIRLKIKSYCNKPQILRIITDFH